MLCVSVSIPPGPHLDQVGESLIDEDEGDEEGEDLLGVAGDESDQKAAFEGHHYQHQQNDPESDPCAAHDILQVVVFTELQAVRQRNSGQTDVGLVTL